MSRRRTPGDWRNWSGSVHCEPNHCAYPVTLEQIQAEVLRVAEDGERLRVIGAGHSWSPLCWSDDNHLSLARYTGIEAADHERHRVWVRGGTRLRQLAEALAERGWALDNAPDHDAQTVAGAIATGTHGSGAAFGSLGTKVTGLRLVCANGAVRECSAVQDPELFDAARLSLGALGVITHVELRCVDDYRLRRRNRLATLGESLARIDELRRDHRNLSLFWFPHAGSVIQRSFDVTRDPVSHLAPLKRLRRRMVDLPLFHAASEAARRTPRLAEHASALIMRRAGHRDDVASAQNAYALERSTRVVAMEYAIPVARLPDTLRQLERSIRTLRLGMPLPVEIRFVHQDDIWLSPQYQRDSACITIPAFADSDYAVPFAVLGELFDRVEGRPHWATYHHKTVAQLRALYPRYDDFRALRQRLDPRGIFINPHLAALFGLSLS